MVNGAVTTVEQLSDVLSEFARTIAMDFPIRATLDRLVKRIVDVLPITAAGVTLISPDADPRSVAASDESAFRFEKLQTELGEGPCLEAYYTGVAVAVADLRVGMRFPAVAPRAVDAGLLAVFTFPLRSGTEQFGALDLYRHTPGMLDDAAMAAAQTFADVAAAYLLNAQARSDLSDTSDRSADTALHDTLVTSEEGLRLLVDGTLDFGIFMLDPDGMIVSWNPGAQRINGYTDAEAIGQHLSIVYTDEARASGRPQHELAIASATGRHEEEAWQVRKDGSKFWANIIITPVFDKNGRSRGFSTVTRDLTERETTTQALLASEEGLRQLVDGALEYGIFMLDPEGIIVSWNLGAQRIKGYTAVEAIGQHFSIFYTDEARASGHPAHELTVARAEGRYEEEGWRVRKDGSQFWASVIITPVFDNDGSVRGFSKVTRDLTERQTTRALVASEERFHRVFDDSPTAIYVADGEGRFVQANEAMAALTGYRPEVLLTMNVLDITHPDDRTSDRDAFMALANGGLSSYTRDQRYLRADGSIIWIHIHAVPLQDPDGQARLVLGHALDITQQRHYEGQLVHLANHDPLTGLANRAKFREELAGHLERCRRYGATGAVLMLDLDNFKRVNDSLGHNAGDELIIATAALLHSRLRSADVVARLGGDEFAILLPAGGRKEAEHVAGAVVQAVRDDVTTLDGGRPRSVSVSVGIAVIDNANLSPHELLAAADLAMYDAKEAGRGRYALYADDLYTVARSRSRITWAERVEDALANDRFELWAQPVLDLRSDEVTSHELLLRMRTPDGEIIEPGRFLYIAERVGLIGEIDRWVTTQAVGFLARLQLTRPLHRLEVNLSGLSVGDEGQRDHIASTISTGAVDPAGLVFEITETAAVEHVIAAREFAESLREIGCSFALDDFGAGFGSFYYLKHLPFDYVKIDGEFAATCTTNLMDQLVIESLVRIASGLGKRTIAEFVGDEATLDFLRHSGVDQAQGYYIGRPAPITEAFPELAMHAPR
jgi:diguanylate cyclase (GGDEF)-like protein/PAS domain S-box-containing protein